MPDLWGMAATGAKFGLFLGVFGATGLIMIRLIFGGLVQDIAPRIRQRVIVLAVLGLVATLAGFSVRGAALTGDAAGMVDPEILGLLWQTSVGTALVTRCIGLLMIIVGVVLSRHGFWIALAGGSLCLWSFTQIGHVPDAEFWGLRLLLLVHLFGIALWIGVLSPLKWLCSDVEQLPRATQLGHQFGRIAAGFVPVLLVAGGVMAWVLLGDFRALVTTGYGQMLLAKLVLVALLLGLAAANKLRFVPQLLARDCTGADHLKKSVSLEWWIVIAILAATAILTSVLGLPS